MVMEKLGNGGKWSDYLDGVIAQQGSSGSKKSGEKLAFGEMSDFYGIKLTQK